MERIVDARGLSCPQPVLQTKKALEEMEAGVLVALVDNEVARDNVVRFARSQSLEVDRITREEPTGLEQSVNPVPGLVVLISGATLGRGDEELGRLLMQSFLGTLAQADHLPQKVFLLHAGVKLACEGSPVLASLLLLEQKGVEIAACATCLDYYGLKEKLCVGSMTNMYGIVEALAGAEKVLNL